MKRISALQGILIPEERVPSANKYIARMGRANINMGATLLLMALVLFAFGACKDNPRSERSATPEERESVRVVQENAEPVQRVTTGLDLPDGFPDDVFIVNGAEITAASYGDGQHQVGYLVEGEIENLAVLYETQMQTFGWRVTQKIVASEKAEIRFSKPGEKRGALLEMVFEDSLIRAKITVSRLTE